MCIEQDLQINRYQTVCGINGTELGKAFDYYVKKYGYRNIYYICSLVYTLGKIHGKREERARRKRGVAV